MAATKFDYLRNRPFLVITTYAQPNGAVRTERKGWQKLGSAKHDEPQIVHRISHTSLRRASIIIDLVNDRVIKNRQLSTMMFDDEALAYCKSRFAELIAPSMLNLDKSPKGPIWPKG